MAQILIVEAEPTVLVLTESYLRKQGHHTVSAATKEQVVAVLDVAEGIDLLFTNIEFKDDLQAGFEVAKLAHERFPKIKVLYATGQTVTDGMKAMMVEGSAVLEKPYTVDQLEAALVVHFGIKPSR